MNTALLLEGVLDSGGTIIRLVDFIERSGAQHALVYAVIRRGPAQVVRQLQKVTRYGHSDLYTKVLGEVDLPSYRSHNCPFCWRGARLREVWRLSPSAAPWIEERLASLAVVPIAASGATPKPDFTAATDLEYLWRCELAKTVVSERARLANILRERRRKPSEALSLLRTLGRNRPFSALEGDMSRLVLYSALVNEISAAVAMFLLDADIPAHDLELLLTVADDFSPSVLLDTYATMLEKERDPRRAVVLLLHTVFSRRFESHPRLARHAIDQLYLPAVVKIADELSNYWRNVEGGASTATAERLRTYGDLCGGSLHDLEHRINRILRAKRGAVPIRTLIAAWGDVEERLSEIQSTVRGFVGGRTSANGVRELANCAAEIGRIIVDTRELIQTHTHLQTTDGEGLKRFLVSAADAAKSTSARVGAGLQRFRGRLKHLVYDVLQQHQENLRAAGIRFHISFPDGACDVFGEDVDLRSIIDNLVKNVWAESRASEMLARIEIATDDSVTLTIADNGRGLPATFVYGDGLRDVDAAATALGGSFAFADPTVLKLDALYKTAAVVKFVYLPSPYRGGDS
jgi:signal transduction histidine kinase